MRFRIDALSRRRNLPMNVPKILPRLTILPQKHLPFDQAAIAVYAGNLPHLIVAEVIGPVDDGVIFDSDFAAKYDRALALLGASAASLSAEAGHA